MRDLYIYIYKSLKLCSFSVVLSKEGRYVLYFLWFLFIEYDMHLSIYIFFSLILSCDLLFIFYFISCLHFLSWSSKCGSNAESIWATQFPVHFITLVFSRKKYYILMEKYTLIIIKNKQVSYFPSLKNLPALSIKQLVF